MSYAEAQYTVDEVISGLQKTPPPLSFEPDNLKDLRIVPGDGHVYIHFTASDTIIDGKAVSSLKGVLIRRKIGGYPENENDGDLVLDVQDELLNVYSSTPYMDDGLENGTEYFYRLFPYNNYGLFNRSMVNSGSATPAPASIWGFHQDFTVLDPEDSITYIGAATNFTPMFMAASSASGRTNGSWQDWVWFKKNQPYQLYIGQNASEMTDEQFFAESHLETIQLNPDNHGKTLTGATTDLNGSGSPSNSGYQFRHDYVWFPKIYMKEVYAADGNSRDVYFAMKAEGDTADFIPVGFINKNGEEMEGVWIATSYAQIQSHPTNVSYGFKDGKTRVHIMRGTPTQSNVGISTWQAYLNNTMGASRSAWLGGPILNVIRDMLYMLFKTTNIQAALGHGLMSTTGEVYMPTNSNVKQFKGFYGYTAGQSTMIMAFHTYSLASYFWNIADPYSMLVSYDLYMSPNYNYSMTDMSKYKKTPIRYTTTSLHWPARLAYCGDGLGSMPAMDTTNTLVGTSSTGLTDALVMPGVANGYSRTLGRFGHYTNNTNTTKYYNGPGSVTVNNVNLGELYNTLCIPMILPPPGYEPPLAEE